ncbi:hypothetical protein [Streptomyces sp. NPDC088178]|uniref:hypothetical protein n=1 Tax=Streptomyces sp. NPDC088178 TaxID=3365836 RepID=UPI0037F959E2
MSDTAPLPASGRDLARQVLAAYKSTARPGTQPKPRTRPDPLLASIQAATAYKYRGANQPVRRAFDVA